MQQFRGTGVALVTPFHEDLSVDFDALAAVVEHSISGGVDYLVVLGTTAESATLSDAEKREVIECIKTVTNKRKPLVLGVGGNDTRAIIEQLEKIDFDGFDAILSVSPFYNKPTQDGIYAHFAAVATASPLPIIMYNVPSRTGSNMAAETTLRLARDFENVIGIKEASGDIVQAMELLRGRPEGFLVISGDDMIALPMVSAGGDGVISVIGQGVVAPFCEMIAHGLAGAFAKAYTCQFQLMSVIDYIFAEGNPAGIKSLLNIQGICGDKVRLPLLKASPELREKLTQFLKEL